MTACLPIILLLHSQSRLVIMEIFDPEMTLTFFVAFDDF